MKRASKVAGGIVAQSEPASAAAVSARAAAERELQGLEAEAAQLSAEAQSARRALAARASSCEGVGDDLGLLGVVHLGEVLESANRFNRRHRV